MFETYRMLGREHEADLAREAEKVAQAAEARRGSPRRRRFDGLRAVMTDLPRFTWPRRSEGSPREERRPTI
jgi:hypothetical protein